MARARKTNLRDFTASVCERTMRAVSVQPKIPITIIMFIKLGLVSATITTINGKLGITSIVSVKRISRFSVRPP